ncbi:hypothetical protein CRV24_001419 [Beauveria bassiana]|nr:hypothetical protein CRV24_001419 [Beauveria bassiana]
MNGVLIMQLSSTYASTYQVIHISNAMTMTTAFRSHHRQSLPRTRVRSKIFHRQHPAHNSGLMSYHPTILHTYPLTSHSGRLPLSHVSLRLFSLSLQSLSPHSPCRHAMHMHAKLTIYSTPLFCPAPSYPGACISSESKSPFSSHFPLILCLTLPVNSPSEFPPGCQKKKINRPCPHTAGPPAPDNQFVFNLQRGIFARAHATM